MAKTTENAQRLRELTSLAENSRISISKAVQDLQQSTQMGHRVEASFRENIYAWMGAAAVVGLVLARLPSRKKKGFLNKSSAEEMPVAKSAGWLALLGVIFQIFRPILQKILAEQVQSFAANKFAKESPRRV